MDSGTEFSAHGTFSMAYYTVKFLTIWLNMGGSDITLAQLLVG